MDGLREFVAGGLGGSVGIFVCQPLDMVKVRLQSGRRATLSGIARTEGFRSLWKGLSVPLYTSALLNAVVFHSYGRALGYLLPEGANPASASLSAVFAAGCVSGAASSLITSPVDMLKIRAQVVVGGARGPVRSPGAMEIARRAIRSGGLPGLFNGLGATLLRDVPSYGCVLLPVRGPEKGDGPRGGHWRARGAPGRRRGRGCARLGLHLPHRCGEDSCTSARLLGRAEKGTSWVLQSNLAGGRSERVHQGAGKLLGQGLRPQFGHLCRVRGDHEDHLRAQRRGGESINFSFLFRPPRQRGRGRRHPRSSPPLP